MTSDDQPNLPAVSTPVHKTVEIPIAVDEGEFVRYFIGKFPADSVELPVGYPRGTHLKFEMEARIRRTSTDEYTGGKRKGELYREHLMVIEEVRLIGAYAHEEVDPGTGGDLSEYDEELEEASDARPKSDEEEQDVERSGDPGSFELAGGDDPGF